MTRISIILALGGALFAGGCRGQVSEEAPIVPIRNMYEQPRYDSQQASTFFEDGRTMRPPIEGTIAVEMESNATISTGRTEDNSAWLLEVPTDVVARFHPERGSRSTATGRWEHATWGALNAEEQQDARRAMLERGQERYNIYCTPCHSEAGDGLGLIAQRGLEIGASAIKPPSFHADGFRSMPDGQLYATITNGIRNMPAYSQSVPLADRWAIVSYVRALQIVNPEAPAEENEQ